MSSGTQAARPGQPPGRAPRRPISVLIVDDDVDIRDTLVELLEHAGYTVATAGNGLEALARLEEVLPQVVLLDLSMPIMSGQEFRTRQLADPTLAAIPTVVLSATDRLADKTAEMGVTESVAKPFTLRRLLDIIARHCGPP